MVNVEKNELDWAKDSVLTEEILTAMNSTEEHDFVFAVSVQPHGKYPNYETVNENGIQVLRCHENDFLYEVEYYVNQLHEVDTFVGELLLTLKNYPEDVVVVLYGDHLPTLGIEDEDMFDGNMYTTEYVVWSNCGFEHKAENLSAFELSSKILGELGISGGNIFRVQRELSDDPHYSEYMHLLSYDMLSNEGKSYSLGGSPLPAKNTVYGFKEIKITGIEVYDDIVFVYGENFTDASFVFLDGKKRETVRISDTLILATKVSIKDGTEVYVAQLSDRSTLLSKTDSVRYTAPGKNSGGGGDTLPDIFPIPPTDTETATDIVGTTDITDNSNVSITTETMNTDDTTETVVTTGSVDPS